MSKTEIETTKPKLYLETTIDFDGYGDYYSGHGHAFSSDKLLCCLRFGPSITYKETVKEIIDAIIEDLNAYGGNEEFMNDAENSEELQSQILDLMTSENFEASIRAQLKPDTKDSDKFFDVSEEETVKDDPEDMMQEYPVLLGYVHVYKE